MRSVGLACVVLALVTVPWALGCGGCPRAGVEDRNETLSGNEQPVQSHEDPDHVLWVDDAFLVAGSDDPIDPAPLEAQAVHTVIASQSVDLRRCYEHALSEHPELHGRVVLELRVESTGHVRSADVIEDTVNDGVLTDCFADHARQWHFPESARDTTLRYPFDLRPALGEPPAAES